MTTRLYPDINIVHLLRARWTPAEFDRQAQPRGVTLAIGMHVVYELARGFVKGANTSEVRAGCHFLSEARCIEYLPSAQDVVRAELSEAVSGVPLITVLPPLNQVATRLELTRLANGYGEQAATFISRRDESVRIMNPRIAAQNRRDLRSLRKMEFETFRRHILPSGPQTLAGLARQVGIRASPEALSRVLRCPLDFPALTSWLNAQWYFGWIAVHVGQVPGKLDDVRHLVESARCDGFVTDDRNLTKIVPQIRPSCPCRSGQDLLNILM